MKIQFKITFFLLSAIVGTVLSCQKEPGPEKPPIQCINCNTNEINLKPELRLEYSTSNFYSNVYIKVSAIFNGSSIYPIQIKWYSIYGGQKVLDKSEIIYTSNYISTYSFLKASYRIISCEATLFDGVVLNKTLSL